MMSVNCDVALLRSVGADMVSPPGGCPDTDVDSSPSAVGWCSELGACITAYPVPTAQLCRVRWLCAPIGTCTLGSTVGHGLNCRPIEPKPVVRIDPCSTICCDPRHSPCTESPPSNPLDGIRFRQWGFLPPAEVREHLAMLTAAQLPRLRFLLAEAAPAEHELEVQPHEHHARLMKWRATHLLDEAIQYQRRSDR